MIFKNIRIYSNKGAAEAAPVYIISRSSGRHACHLCGRHVCYPCGRRVCHPCGRPGGPSRIGMEDTEGSRVCGDYPGKGYQNPLAYKKTPFLLKYATEGLKVQSLFMSILCVQIRRFIEAGHNRRCLRAVWGITPIRK